MWQPDLEYLINICHDSIHARCQLKLVIEMKTIKVLVPKSRETQREIVEYLDGKCKGIDQLIAIKEAKVDRLRQLKKTLIYEYVTGKKEVV